MSSTDKALDPGPGAGARGAVGQARRHLAAGLPLRYLGLLLVCLILMKPIMVDSDPRLAPVVKALTGCVFAGILLVHTLRRAPVSTALVLFVLYRWVMLVPTVANGGDLLNWGYATVAQLSILMLIDLFVVAAEPADRRRLLRVMADLLLAYLMINYVMILAGWGTVTGWGDGQLLAQPSYLLGIRTRITDTAFPALLVCLLYESGGPRPWGLRSLMALGLGVVQILTLDVATASVGVVVAVVVYALVLAVPPARRVVSMRGATVLGMAGAPGGPEPRPDHRCQRGRAGHRRRNRERCRVHPLRGHRRAQRPRPDRPVDLPGPGRGRDRPGLPPRLPASGPAGRTGLPTPRPDRHDRR